MTDEERYSETLLRKYREHEALCNRCGACCGILDGDPCEHLEKTPNGLYACDIYEQRFGLRKTIKGEPVLCVPIHNVLHKTWWGRARCVYIRRI